MNAQALLIVGLAIALAVVAWLIYKLLDYFDMNKPTRVARMNTQVLRMLRPGLTLIGVALLVYNLLGFEMYGVSFF